MMQAVPCLVSRYVKIGPEPRHIYPDGFSLHIPPEDMNNRAIRGPAVLNLVDGNFYIGNRVKCTIRL